MSEDPLLRAVTDAVDDYLGLPRKSLVDSGFVAPRAGTARPHDDLLIYINGVRITEPTPYKKGDWLRTAPKRSMQ